MTKQNQGNEWDEVIRKAERRCEDHNTQKVKPVN
jgi:hypothetical protein